MSKILKLFVFSIAGVAASFSFDVNRLKNIDGKAPPSKGKNVRFDSSANIDDTEKKLSYSKNRNKNLAETKQYNLESSNADAQATAAILNKILEEHIQAKKQFQQLAKKFMKTYNGKIDDPSVMGPETGLGGQKHIQTEEEAIQILEKLENSSDTVAIEVKDSEYLGTTEGAKGGWSWVYIASGANSREPLTPVVKADKTKIRADNSQKYQISVKKAAEERQKIRGKILSGKARCPEKLTDAIFMSGLRNQMNLAFKSESVKNIYSTPVTTQNFLDDAQKAGFLTVVDGKKGLVVARIKELDSDSFQGKDKAGGKRVLRSCSYTVPEIAALYQSQEEKPSPGREEKPSPGEVNKPKKGMFSRFKEKFKK